MPAVQLLCGDSRETLKTLPKGCVQTVITSPPYFQLRDYEHEGQIGHETTPETFVSALVEVFREVRRVLRDDGTVWLNLASSYAGGAGRWGGYDNLSQKQGSNVGSHGQGKSKPAPSGYKPKDLIPIPWLVGIALQQDGWWLRSDNIWNKTNAMPSSVEDRTTLAHEYVLMLSKRASYFWDQDGVREPHADVTLKDSRFGTSGTGRERYSADGLGTCPSGYAGAHPQGRNLRSVWSFPTRPFSAKALGIKDTDHYAAFPEELVRLCLLAGTSERGCCPQCGAPWRRVVEKERYGKADSATKYDATMQGGPLSRSRQAYRAAGLEGPPAPITLGWSPSCVCETDEPVPCTILDPFAGTGTVGEVALKHNRHAILGELNPAYQRLIRARCIRSENLFSGRAFA